MSEVVTETFSRNELYWGVEFQHTLKSKHVAVLGLGGVGGFCAEALVRAGIGELTIFDFDNVSQSNINRQIIALNSTIGRKKTELFEKRLKDINPGVKLNIFNDFYNEKSDAIKADFVADAIDTMRSKIFLLEYCVKNKIPVISSMGAGNRIDPTKLYICDIKDIKDKNAAFVSNIIYQLKKLGIESGITVVASREKPFVQKKLSQTEHIKTKAGEKIEFVKITPSSTPFVASAAGIFMASYIIQEFKKEFENG